MKANIQENAAIANCVLTQEGWWPSQSLMRAVAAVMASRLVAQSPCSWLALTRFSAYVCQYTGSCEFIAVLLSVARYLQDAQNYSEYEGSKLKKVPQVNHISSFSLIVIIIGESRGAFPRRTNLLFLSVELQC
jgi:glucan phosphoethanolaminetransferase (alkaline phosphatase superfamily)